MKNSYREPSVVAYDFEQILELIGPAITQYDASVTPPPPPPPPPPKSSMVVQPISILRNKEADVKLAITLDGNPTFTSAEVIVPFSIPLKSYSFSSMDGTLLGNVWELTLTNFIQETEGVYDIQVTLFDGTNTVSTCSGSIGID